MYDGLPSGMFAKRGGPPFSLTTLLADSNCVLIQDPSAVWGVQDFLPRRNLLLATDALATQNVTVVATAYKLYMQGTGSITLSGTGSGTLNGTGANDRVSLSFTPTAGTLTLTVSGTVTFGMLCRADTIDQSYQRITDWTTEQYAWAAQKQVPWLRRNRFLNTATLSTQTVSSVTASPITVSFKGTGTITFSTAYSGSLVGTGASDRVSVTFTPSAGNLVCTVTGTVTEAQCENGSAATTYQPILADWDTTYTAAAIAAGYPISLWTDSAGTKAISSDNQPIGKMLDMKGTYTATQATTANQPKWRLDANGKPYIERDLTNDSLPITLPTVLSDAQLGPELVTNGTFTESATGWTLSANVSYSNNAIVFDGGSTSAYARQESVTTEGKTYRVCFTISSYTSGGLRFMGGTGGAAISMPVTSYTAIGDYSFIFTASSTTAGRFWVYSYTTAFNGTVDNISVREVTGTNVVYTAEGNVSLKDSGLILSGSYSPITPAADYGRIIMAADSRYDAKIIKYLDGKRGRAYSLGPELVSNGGFDTDTVWTKGAGWSIGSGVASASSAADATMVSIASVLTSGKTYLVQYDVTSLTGGGVRTYAGATTGATRSAVGRYQGVIVCGATNQIIGVAAVGTTTASIDNVSVREVLL